MKMEYDVKAHPTEYKYIQFRSRLEAHWACFFDSLNWYWEYEPVDLEGWTPDFFIRQPCGHSECGGFHEIYCEVKPYRNVEQFEQHPSNRFGYGCLGLNPGVTKIEIIHGSGGGVYNLMDFCSMPKTIQDICWNESGNLTQWKGVRNWRN